MCSGCNGGRECVVGCNGGRECVVSVTVEESV